MRALRFFASFTLVSIPMLAGCSLVIDTDPPDPVQSRDLGTVDAASSDARPPAVDGGPIDLGCTTSAACDDGVYCNGVEECVAGACVASPVPCPDVDGLDCTVPVCDGALDACVEVPHDGLCAPGSHCDPVDGCSLVPDCIGDADCVPLDPCSIGSCAAGTCIFAPLDCATALPALSPADCRAPACDGVRGCVYAPVNTRCDDGVGCTDDVCRNTAGLEGTCAHEPRPALCDDRAACTVDTCDPLATCVDATGAVSGCRHAPDAAVCAVLAADVRTVYPGLACATPVCVGPTAGNAAGCSFEGGCMSGQHCTTSGGPGFLCVTATLTGPCATDDACSDGNPCNGVEHCVSSACQPSSTPLCPTPLDTCALSDIGPICAPPAELCAIAVGP